VRRADERRATSDERRAGGWRAEEEGSGRAFERAETQSALSPTFTEALYNRAMPISARNKLRGKIEEIQLGDVMAHVVVRVGENLIESVITRRSADELKLKKGDTVAAVVKATEVMIQKD
jgi:molybdopterin-binding protein